MLKLERELASLRREEDTKIEGFKQDMEARFREMQYTASLQQNTGCLGGLFGGKNNSQSPNGD